MLPAYRHLNAGAPETEVMRVYNGYVTAYDYRTRNPKWVLERITPASWSGEANR
jgi:endonuclease G